MRKLSQRRRRRRLTRQAKRAITLSVEALEPRLVLSAAGFGLEGVGERSDLHDRDHSNREADQPAIAARIHDGSRNRQLALPAPRMDRPGPNSIHFEPSPPQPGPGRPPRGGQPIEPIGAIPCQFVPCGPRTNHPPGKTLDSTAGAEGESTFSTDNLGPLASPAPVDVIFTPTLPVGGTVSSTIAVFVSLPPANSSARGGGLLDLAQPAPRVAQPPRASTLDPASQPSSSPSTLPVSASVSSPASTRLPPASPNVLRYDSPSSNGDALPDEPATEGRNIVVAPVNRLSESVLSTIANERATASPIESLRDRLPELSPESLWAALSEGGFIAIETDAADNSHERFDSAADTENAAASKRLSTAKPRDAFWFDFSDARLDLIFDSSAIEKLAADQTVDVADRADDEAWLLDDGGMIVLTSSPHPDQAVEAAVDGESGSSSNREAEAGEADIPMDAGIGVFQAIEVATTVAEPQDGLPVDEGTTTTIEGEATAGAEDAVPAAEQAAKNSESGLSEPIRAASTPLLLAIAAVFSDLHQRRKQIADRPRQA